MCERRFLGGFEQDFMCHKLAMKFIERDRIRSEVECGDDTVKVTSNITINNGIKLS